MSEGQVARVAEALRPLLGEPPDIDSRACPASTSPSTRTSRRLNASLGFDRRLWPQDVAQSRAHAAMLAGTGIIGGADRDALLAGLDAVAERAGGGTLPVRCPTTRTSTWRSSGA